MQSDTTDSPGPDRVDGERAGGAPQAELLTAEDVGGLLNCSARTVRRMADSGRIPAPVRLGRLVRWDRQGLLDWIAEGCPSCKRRR